MNCQRCGALLADGVTHCHNCGTPQQFTNAGYQPNYGQQQYGQHGQVGNVDMSDLNVGLKILFLLFPLIGIIMYFVWKNSAPVKAKSSLTFGLIGIGVNILLSILI